MDINFILAVILLIAGISSTIILGYVVPDKYIIKIQPSNRRNPNRVLTVKRYRMVYKVCGVLFVIASLVGMLKFFSYDVISIFYTVICLIAGVCVFIICNHHI